MPITGTKLCARLLIIYSLALCLFCLSEKVRSAVFVLDEKPNIAPLSHINGEHLCQVAANTKQYLELHSDDNFAVHAGAVFNDSITLADVKKTLAFLCQVHQQDQARQQRSRLHERQFLLKHFDFYRWQPDKKTANKLADNSANVKKAQLLRAIPEQKILLTKYYTKLLKGSEVKTEQYNQALYALPFDEQGLTLEQAGQQQHQLTRFKYSRQDIIAGVLAEKKLAQPLIWLTEEALHDVLLQGTGVLVVKGRKRYFNVHRNNGIGYDYTLGKREQARYWYFAEVPSIMGYGDKLQNKIAIKPYVSFAGNVAQLGLGKLFMVSYQQQQAGKTQQISQVGVLADQGGAFEGNLFQLDYLVDSYWGWRDYHQANKHLADYAQAWLMLLKPIK